MLYNHILALILIIVLFLLWRHSCKPIYWFFRESCPYCVSMKDEWTKFKYMTMFSMIMPIDVDIATTEGQHLSKLFSVSSVPTLVKMNKNIPTIYNGTRKAHDIYLWAIQN